MVSKQTALCTEQGLFHSWTSLDRIQALKTPEDVIRAAAASPGETPRRLDGLQAYLATEARRRAGPRVSRSRVLLEVLL